MADAVMPAAFLGHGSPMNALEENRYTRTWAALGASVPRPRAILAISAHWYTNATAVTAMAEPRTIHDFFGFPEELFAFQYRAPGAPEVANEVIEALKPRWAGLDKDSWGLDHGTWSVLAHAFPAADIPVVQLSVNALQTLEYHLELGTRLAPLREQGVLVVASGNVVPNLGRIDWAHPDGAYAWAQRFDEAVRSVVTSSPEDVLGLSEHADYGQAVPTPDHIIPLLYFAGLAAAAGQPADVLVDGYAYGSLSMTCYTLDANSTEVEAAGGVGELPDPRVTPPDETNV
jgi:4,5-DOPA dioxygenase extradiol